MMFNDCPGWGCLVEIGKGYFDERDGDDIRGIDFRLRSYQASVDIMQWLEGWT